MIINNDDLLNESNKIVDWINKVLKKEVFKDLIINVYDGYVYITRKGAKIKDNITKELISDLN